MTRATNKGAREPIAIIGVGMRLPGADNLDAFWAHLAAGRSLIKEVPERRWDKQALRGDPASGDKTNSIWGGFLDDADAFDAAFFNVSPREAQWMDPQQRFALEMAWHAIEDAGLRASSLAGSRTGVYMGVCHWDYAELIEKHLARLDAYTPTGIAFSVIANRVSHFFDFRGPSVTNDTACAASLVSVHDAVRALQAGDCDLALAGGVNLIWSPNHFIAFSKSGMLSKDGQAKAFDARADGYVRGEGGAVLLLKPLSAAQADGDPIHAIISGIETNHGGRTNSLTVTNPAAQADLIASVHRAAAAAPETISYIEAHGPGTPLGDPIEIAGLKKAFEARAAETGSAFVAGTCGIGSVKTNIGHLEGAAGIAGVVKVLAALRHEVLPPNVDFQTLNPLISLEGSPFRIQNEATSWPRQEGRVRRAGVSSFGFGGANAHALIEDVAPLQRERAAAEGRSGAPLVVPLSARTDEALVAYAREVRAFVAGAPDVVLADLAATFQVGREVMRSRVAFIVEDLAEFSDVLDAFIEGAADTRVRLPGADCAAAEPWRSADLWAGGEDVAWAAIPGARRIQAPLYPFVRERFWFDTAFGAKDAVGAVPHPFLHRNLSRFDVVAYQSRFSGQEFFFAEHHVHGRKILPGVVALEMARAAFARSGEGEAGAIRLRDVVWSRAVVADDAPVDVRVHLERDAEGATSFSIESGKDASDGAVCVRGRIDSGEAAAPDARDVAQLKSACNDEIDVETCYARLVASGVVHGPTFRALSAVRRGGGAVVADLRLPRRLVVSLSELPLHPVMLDAAIQAWVALETDAPAAAGVPFACREIACLRPCEARMVAIVSRTAEARSASGVVRLDIDLCNEAGDICVSFRELSLRLQASQAAIAERTAAMIGTCVRASGVWAEVPANEARDVSAGADTTILLASDFAGFTRQLAGRTGAAVETLPYADGRSTAEAATLWFQAVLARLQAMIAARPKRSQRVIVLVPDGAPALLASPLAGLLRTVSLEAPKISGALVRIAGSCDIERLAGIAHTEMTSSDAFVELRHDAEGRRLAWRPVEIGDEAEPDAAIVDQVEIDAGGSYWVTGGLGGLGRIFADALVAKGARRIVLSGRHVAMSADCAAQVEALKAKGADVRVMACDVTDAAAVNALVASVNETFGPLRGIIHAAGVLDDAYILNADASLAGEVLAPKIAGTLNIDDATAALDLDFLMVCSSVASAFGNAGQGAYAGGNAFLDAFAEYRALRVQRSERRGVTRSIAWPLWANGGMTVEGPFLDALHARFGTVPMPSVVGVEALWQSLSGASAPRVAVLYGDRVRIREVFAEAAQPKSAEPVRPDTEIADAGLGNGESRRTDLVELTTGLLKELLAEATQIDPARIRAHVPLVEYGLDSIVIIDVTTRLERVVGPLSKTLFFEHVTLASLAAHLAEEHAGALSRAFPAGPQNAATTSQARADSTSVASEPKALSRDEDTHDVAIIGMSLRVAKAASQEDFWRMLSEGGHAFGPVPHERWNHKAIYHPERGVLGKTVVKSGAFLDDIDKFDPRYFRISQAEAELMSPEVRLFLEASVEAFEDAGYSRETMQAKFGGDVAVLVGSMTNEYDYYGLQNGLVRGALASGSYTGTLPNMVSYFYGFTGPSYFLDTMCSAASTCVHEAVHMLRAGRCRMALAGGVSLLLHPQKLIAVSQENFTSKSADVVRGYGVGADGTILGEGVGALVLKRRADAERDGDHIYGVIKGTAVSNAGVRNGFTVPNPAQQAAAISKAIDDAGIDPRSIGYVEGHGSGTALGDPIEIRALTQAYRAHTQDNQFCPIGTVKSNVAHLLAAAGLAGIVKVLLQMKHGQLVPSLHAETLNPDIPFETTPFYVQRTLSPWTRGTDAAGRALPRRAGVTSIGAGGMNSHIIIEEGDIIEHGAEAERDALPKRPEIVLLSAMTKGALLRHAARMRAHIAANADLALSDVAFTLQVGRNALACRLAIVVEDREVLLAKLDGFLSGADEQDDVVFTPNTLDRDARIDANQLAVDVSARALDRVARAWADGAAVDWERLHTDRAVQRVSLPSYPFERVRCWYPEYPDALSVTEPLATHAGSRQQPLAMRQPAPRKTRDEQPRADSGSLLTAVTRIAAELLKFDPEQIGARAPFYDLGFDSISLTRFAALIGDRIGVTVSPAIFFDCEHIEALCRHLEGRGAGVAAPLPAQPVLAAERSSSDKNAKVAIVGIGVRLPGADDPEMFIDRLLAGDDLTRELPPERYGADYAARIARAGFAKRGGFLSDVDRFDAAFFRVSPVEAERMDPQQRLMLETTWRALERAGYRTDELPADTGVFIGASGRDYASLLEAHGVAHDGFAATGNSLAMIANRISYHLDVHGPSETVDTACSSSLVALVRAADAVASGQCSMAIAGGVNLALAVEGFEGPHLAGMLSADGRCKTFSASADGYGRGEGVVALVLKSLEAAEADGDAILGVVIGRAVNHGGRAGSLTAPNAKAQTALIEAAMSGIAPESIAYIEAHGTGTALGDPVEVAALDSAYARLGTGHGAPPIYLGTVKSNIGHLEAAAGLAGVAKVLGAMRRGEIPPTLHCATLNPHISLASGRFAIGRERVRWPDRFDGEGRIFPRRAGVSSFGFGGANAHVVIEHRETATPRRSPLAPRAFADTRFWIPGVPRSGAAERDETVLHVPSWSAAPLRFDTAAPIRRRVVLACGVEVAEQPGVLVVRCDDGGGDIEVRYVRAAGAVLDALQGVLRDAAAAPVLFQLVHLASGEGAVFAGIGALLDTAEAECPHLIGCTIGVDHAMKPGDVARLLDDEARGSRHCRVIYRGGGRLARTWRPLAAPAMVAPDWRDGGVYLITGGLGGLGRLIAGEIAARSVSPVLVLAGRSSLDAEREAALDRLRQAGARVVYHQLDVTDAQAVASLVADVVGRYGALHGVVHCAGTLRDRTLLNKTRAEINAVLAPKVAGTLALAEACQGRGLDSFVLFSSLAGAVGNAGQGDYAAANGFLDALASMRFRDLPILSVNWPLWRDGGMKIDAAGEAALFDLMGQRALSTEAGIAALGAAQASGARQVAVVAGDGAKLRSFFAAAAEHRMSGRPGDVPSPDSPAGDTRGIERTAEALRHILARVSGHKAAMIETDVALEEYGIDSLMITRLNTELAGVFGRLSGTLLFEHRSLGALARHLASHHAEGCRRLTGDTAQAARTDTPSVPAAVSRSDTKLAAGEPIAIIGMSGRYPGAADLDAFWANLAAGRDMVGEIPDDRWPLDGFYEADVETAVSRGASYGKWGAFLEGFAEFDPLAFKIAPRDAAAMDPQERLFLMAAWAACEDGGYTRARFKTRHGARVGVFAGATKTGFALHGSFLSEDGAQVRPQTSFASIANRVSHVLDINGPSMPVDTMCSSSLTAIHEACTALRTGNCEVALAGGVNLYLHASNFVELSAARMLSPDGRCRSFGAGANGFVPGEGVGCLLLKPLSRAVADGDRIHAVIRGTAVNHGGRTNGYTVPNPTAQRDVIRAALADAGIDAADVTCIEAHGTGTDLGDPIEVSALTQAFSGSVPRTQACALGSVKSSIGHLEAAAGIAGVTKVVLQMKHGRLAPTLHAVPSNAKIDLDATPFRLQTEAAPWSGKRIAGVSSFGAGGANAHVVLEAWGDDAPSFEDDGTSHVILLSAHDRERLGDYAARLAAFVDASRESSPGSLRLSDIAYTLQVGREAMEERLAFEAKSLDELVRVLRAVAAGESDLAGVYRGDVRAHRDVMAALTGDDEHLAALMSGWATSGRIGRLLALWAQGLAVDWEALPHAGRGRVTSLPTYPFARHRFWVPLAAAAGRISAPRDEVAGLQAESDALDAAIAPLVGAIVAGVNASVLRPPFDRWHAALNALLPSQGSQLSRNEAWAGWDRFKATAAPGLDAQIRLAETTLRALPDILSDKVAAPEVMFPNGRLDLVEAVYKENPVAARFSGALAQQAADIVSARLRGDAHARVRVLEIGAGTGGTSEAVFAALASFGDAISEYRFTDVSRAFLIKAEQRFAPRVPALATALFDVEAPPAEQGIAIGTYDVVVAANVLHATADIGRTLANVLATLAPGGVLLLNETSRATLFTHVTFGLLDGWWRFSDGELRIPGTPSLEAGSWQRVLEQAGFIWRSVSSAEERRLGQQIIVAEAPGVRSDERVRAEVTDIRDILRRAVGETLNMPAASVSVERPFADYGLDSILGAELVEKIRAALGIKIEQTRLYDFGSVERLARFVTDAFPETVAKDRPELPKQPAVVAGIVSATAPSRPRRVGSEVHAVREPIAVVGFSGRFGQSPDAETLWAHLAAGRDLVQPAARFAGGDARRGSFIDSYDAFDPVFFGISGVEATYMDPQQRLFLEEAWKALEHAGHAGAAIEGRRCGVFVGCSAGDYQELFRSQPPGQAFWGNTSSLIPARIAYCLDLKGPAIAIDTACSSSLVALDLACRSLASGESEIAIAGGVFVQCTDRFFRYAQGADMLSPTGRCAAFGADADGIVPGEAVAAVVLRPLSAALADGDTIHGLIVASGTNQDGATNGITAPSGISQQRLMREVYAAFDIDAASIGFVEAHGTGTRLGDPIEYDALATVFSEAGAAKGGCLLGSVKSNLGHATTAAGVTSLMKVIGALKSGVVPATLHVGAGNPAIDIGKGPFRINTHAEPWPQRDGPRRAAISSFGFSGTNAHVVVEQAPEQRAVPDDGRAHLIVLSARTAEQLRLQAERLLQHLASEPGLVLRDVSFTLLAGRRHLAHRLALVARSISDVVRHLSQWLAGEASCGVRVGTVDGDAGCAQGDAQRAADGSDFSLDEVASGYLAGVTPDCDALFKGSRPRRVPLPVYPFAATRYWVSDAASAASAVEPPARPVAITLQPAARRDVQRDAAGVQRVVLAPLMPAKSVRDDNKSSVLSSAKVSLVPVLSEVPAAPVRIPSSLAADGVLVLRPTDAWSSALEAGLSDELRGAGTRDDVRAVLIEVPLAWETHEGVARCDRFVAAVLACAVPVVAAVVGSCNGPAALAVLACDFVVIADDAHLSASGGVDTHGLVDRRLGARLAENLFSADFSHTGSELRQAGLSLPVVARADVMERARQLAGAIARAPKTALFELKRHMRAAPILPGGASPARETLRALATGAFDVSDAPRRVALSWRVVTLERFSDGVALVRMEEREGRNTFTPQLMDGLCEAFAKVGADPSFKAVVLAGYDGYFACGGTIDGLESLQRGETHFTDRRIYCLPAECPLPVVAAMQGHAVGAGWALGMFADLTLFGADSVYHSNYLELGFTPGAGATLIFPHRLGDDLGREVLFSALPVRGRDLKARAPGLHVVSSAHVLGEALKLAHRLALRPRDELVEAKADAIGPIRAALPRYLERELDMHTRTFIGSDEALTRIRAAFHAPEKETDDAASADARNAIDAVRAAVVESLAEELMIGASDIRDGASFLDLGLDSILAVTWVRRLNARFAIELPATAVYAYPTVGGLIARIAALLPSKDVARAATADTAPADPTPAAPRTAVSPARGDAPAAHRDHVRGKVVRSLAEELMIPEGDIRDGSGFLDLGLDSILAVTWVRRLNTDFGVALPATAVYAHPTVGVLVDRIARDVPTTERAEAVAAAASPLPEPMPSQEEPQIVLQPAAVIGAAPRSQSGAVPEARRHPAIAIIGMSGCFPEARDLDAFWENIRAGRDCIREVPRSRWDTATHFDPDPQAPGKSYCKWMGAIGGVDLFDPAFFNITPREAELMDPQQRLFLEHAWHAIEDAAIDPTALSGAACGVFVGSGPSGYADLISERNAYSLLGAAGSILAARISYLLDLGGPAVSLDTACSSSLVAIVEACNSLLLGDSDLALAGGACVLIGPSMFIDTSKVSMLSKDGRCFSFDARANGFVPGEGVGVMLLKRLDDAVRDGDPIRAVIRGWGVNQDGRTNGIAAPNPIAQSRLIRGIHERFGIEARSIGLIECHGTGTALGDPIEVEGLVGAFAGAGVELGACAIGSVKSNVGHLLASAGVAGATKAVLALEHAELPPSIHVVDQNPLLPIAGTPFRVNTALAAWPAPERRPRRAGVSAFGFSGTNAHVVIEAAPARAAHRELGPWVLPLSARTRERLSAYAAAIERFVAARPDLDLAALAATFQQGRTAMTVRRAIVFSSRATLTAALEALARGEDVIAGSRDGAMDALAARWSAGETVTWPETAAHRIQAPGYPFAEERHWVEEAQPTAEVRRSSVDFEARGEGRFAVRLDGRDPAVAALLDEGLAGLLLPAIGRDAARLAGHTFAGLKHLVWSGSVAGESRALPRWVVALSADADGALYSIGDEAQGGRAVHVGAFLSSAGESAVWPNPLDATRLSAEGRDVTSKWQRYAANSRCACAADVVAVCRLEDVLVARLAARTGRDEAGLLHLVWRLIAFSEMNGHTPPPTAPSALESYVATGVFGGELLVQVRHEDGAAFVAAHDVAGGRVLLLDGLMTHEHDDLTELDAQGEILL